MSKPIDYFLFAGIIGAAYGLAGWAFNRWKSDHPPIWRIENSEEPGNPVIFVEAPNQWEAMRAGYTALEDSLGALEALHFFADGVQPITIEKLGDLAFRSLSYRLLRDHNYVAPVCFTCGEAVSGKWGNRYAESEEPYIFCDTECARSMPAIDPQSMHDPVIVTWFDR